MDIDGTCFCISYVGTRCDEWSLGLFRLNVFLALVPSKDLEKFSHWTVQKAAMALSPTGGWQLRELMESGTSTV